MAAETDGRSATESLSSATNGSIHTPATNLQPDGPGIEPGTSKDQHFSGIPSVMPSLFASPFITPYMPQQPSNSIPDSVQPPNFQPNLPTSDAYFLQSMQYQELMQQYFNLMAAATSQTALDLSRQGKMSTDEAQRVFTGSLQAVMQQMQQNLRLSSPYPVDVAQPPASSSVGATASSSPTSTLKHPTNLERNTPLRTTRSSEALFDPSSDSVADSPNHQETSDEKSGRSSLPNARDLVFLQEEPASTFQIPHSFEKQNAEEVGDTSEAAINSQPSTSSLDASQAVRNFLEAPGAEAEQQPSATAIDTNKQSENAASSCKPVESTSLGQPTRQTSEDLLIKKQMNEMDKQINRRQQNKNIRKSALPFGSTATNGEEKQCTPSLNQLKDSFGLSQTSTAPPPLNQFPSQNTFMQQSNPFVIPPNQTVNPAQYSQASPFPFATTVPQMAQTIPNFAQGPMPTFPPTFPFTTSPFFPGAQQQMTPQMAAAILQQLQQSQQHANVASTSNCAKVKPPTTKTETIHPDSNVDKSQWPDDESWHELDARHKSSSEEPPMLTENDDKGEPVWVMRESYLKRIQREEDRNNLGTETQKDSENTDSLREDIEEETEQLLSKNERISEDIPKKNAKKEVIVHEPAVLIEGVLFRARYLGSTQLVSDGRPTKTSRMMQAQEAVARVKAPEGEVQPSTDIDLFISTEKIMVLNTDLQDILMDHALRTISYIADIGDLVVLMARRISQSASEEECTGDEDDCVQRTPKVICHVFESDEASFIAQSIGQAFQVAYVEFLRANGIDDPSYLREIDYQEVLNSQELMGEELEMFARKETQKDVVVPKKAGEPLGVVVVESGWGSMLPTVVIANLQPGGAAARCNLVNIGDQIIAINGISLVGLPLASAQRTIKGAKSSTAVKLTVVSTPPVVEVRIKRPDTKYQLGFSVQNGVICSLLRGGIAERGGIRVGHRIIEINGHSVVAVPHEKIVRMLATAIGEIHMKTMPTSMFRLLTGQEVPNYI